MDSVGEVVVVRGALQVRLNKVFGTRKWAHVEALRFSSQPAFLPSFRFWIPSKHSHSFATRPLRRCTPPSMAERQAQDASAMLLLNGLPPRTQISLDAHPEAFLTNEQFAGVKSLPPGWHCVSWSIAAHDTSSGSGQNAEYQTTPALTESSIRNVMLRWFDKGEITVRELDLFQQRLVVPDQTSAPQHSPPGTGIGQSKRLHFTRNVHSSESRSETTLITPEVLNSVEPRLLPFPISAWGPWRNALRHLSLGGGHIGRKVVARVLGVESSSSDSMTDSLATGPSRANDQREQVSLHDTGNLGRKENGKRIWGKSRRGSEEANVQSFEVEVDGEGASDGTEPDAGAEPKKRKRTTSLELAESDEMLEEDATLLFTSFDLRRSWPPNSVGAALTRWSEDKSWLLQDTARRSSLGITGSSSEAGESDWCLGLLCEFELAFVLFLMASNAYAWEQWKELCALFCRSSSLIGAPSAFQLHPSTIPSSSPRLDANSVHMDAHIAFLETLHAQLNLLDPHFWSSQSSSREEQGLLRELDVLRANLARSLSATGVLSQSQSHSQSQSQSRNVKDGLAKEEQREKLVGAWSRLSRLTANKFGWQLDRRLDEEAEVEDDIEAEEGEDAPVVVEF